MNEITESTAREVDVTVYNEREKLSELQGMILGKGDAERVRILAEARAEAERWTEEQSAHLDAMLAAIRADAAKRSGDVTARQLNDAESARDKNRMRLQNELINKALVLLQGALIDFSNRADYDAVLTGVASEACERLPKGQKVRIRLRAEDALHGEPVVRALSLRFPELSVSFDAEPAAITGGVFLYSEEEKWRVVADWKSKVEEMADSVAKALLAEL